MADETQQAGALLPGAMPSTCFLPGPGSVLTVGAGVNFGTHRQIGSWGVDDV